jgi:hypothetical protein
LPFYQQVFGWITRTSEMGGGQLGGQELVAPQDKES